MSASVRLRRKAGPLLRQVGGMPRGQRDAVVHASKVFEVEDHERSPESSADEFEAPTVSIDDMIPSSSVEVGRNSVAQPETQQTKAVTRKRSRTTAPPRNTTFRNTARVLDPVSGFKSGPVVRKASSPPLWEDENDEVFASQRRRRSEKQATYSSSQRSQTLQNIHANPPSTGKSKDEDEFERSGKRASNEFRAPPSAKRQKTERLGFKTPELLREETENKQRPAFKMPKHYRIDGAGLNEPTSSSLNHLDDLATLWHSPSDGVPPNSSSPLSSPPPDGLLDISDEHFAFVASSQGLSSVGFEDLAHCPACNTAVSSVELLAFTDGRRLRWRDKLAFCQSHKQRAAEQQWSQHRYPKIDWDNFDSRLQSYRGAINGILDGRTPSYYRNELEQKAANSKDNARNSLRNPDQAGQEMSIPGYYGMRGAQRMQEFVVRHFAAKVRRLSSVDALMLSTGITGYVQAVLVSELAVLLVEEDLGVEAEEARKVLKETAEFGDLFNQEEEAKITPQDDADVIHILSQDG